MYSTYRTQHIVSIVSCLFIKLVSPRYFVVLTNYQLIKFLRWYVNLHHTGKINIHVSSLAVLSNGQVEHVDYFHKLVSDFVTVFVQLESKWTIYFHGREILSLREIQLCKHILFCKFSCVVSARGEKKNEAKFFLYAILIGSIFYAGVANGLLKGDFGHDGRSEDRRWRRRSPSVGRKVRWREMESARSMQTEEAR